MEKLIQVWSPFAMPRKKKSDQDIFAGYTESEKEAVKIQGILRKYGVENKPSLVNELLGVEDIDCEKLEINIKNFEDKSQYYLMQSLNKENFQSTFSLSAPIKEQLDWVRQQPQPVQRSKEWYEFRQTILSASSIYKIFQSPSTRRDYLKEKSKLTYEDKKISSPAIDHGVKYEEVATQIYAARNSTVVEEYGCIRHPSIHCIGASPDGISNESNEAFAGRMLEIKCPYSRIITGIPKFMYWVQVQLQLEVCNLDICDFLECSIKEIDKDQFFERDIVDQPEKEHGIVITYLEGENNNKKFIYSPIAVNIEEREALKSWLALEMDKDALKTLMATGNDYDSDDDNVTVSYWYLEVYSETPIYRSREWFNLFAYPWIIQFWEEVQAEKEKARNPGKPTTVAAVAAPVCMITSDDES